MRITKPVALGAAGWKRHTGSLPINLQATRSNAAAARSPITLFAGDTRARFIARLFTFGQRCDRLDCWIQSTTDRYHPRFPWCIRSISLVKNCTNFLFLPCFIFCFFFLPVFGLLPFLLFGFVLFYATRYGQKGVASLEIRLRLMEK